MAARSTPVEPKTCAACGRTITWRKKWEKNWDQIKYCSDACRSRRPGPPGEALERAILALLDARARGASVCPSEAARHVYPDSWQDHMEDARAAARRLAAREVVEITQDGRPVDASTARGPIRVRKSRARSSGSLGTYGSDRE